MRRFPSAEAANLLHEGAAAYLRQLILTNLASEYDNEIRLLMGEIKGLDEISYWQLSHVLQVSLQPEKSRGNP